jgi:hypothetical protein
MLHHYLNEYTPYLILGIVGLFTIVKLFKIKTAGLDQAGQVFMESLGIYSEQSIRNTFHKHRKQYYKASNRINTLFYAALVVALGIYLFMRMI